MTFIIVTMDQFPSGDAGSVRELSFSKLLIEIGHKVIIISQADTLPFVENFHQGIKYISLRADSNKFVDRVMNYFGHRRRLKRAITTLNKTDQIDAIWMTQLPTNSLFYLKYYARKRNIKLFYDGVEWFSPQNFKWGFLSFFYLVNELWNRLLIDQQFSVISISTFLNDHFKARMIPSIRIPVILDTQEIPFLKQTHPDKLVILYAGSPAKKDYIKEIIEGMTLLNWDELNRIELKLIGVNFEQLTNQCGVENSHINKCRDSIKTFGRISREEVINQLHSADFTILMRSPILRYAKAGFPTKVAESLATATPVICNITSDLAMYLKNGENSIIVESLTPESVVKAMRKALNLSQDKKHKMFLKARQTAEQYFDYRIYMNILSHFLNEICLHARN